MKVPRGAVTLREFGQMRDDFLANCHKGESHLIHNNCGGGIRTGYMNLFFKNDDGSIDPGPDGFGIGPKQVPYCEKCDPPDGHHYTYATSVTIKRDPSDKIVRVELTDDDIAWLTGTGRFAQ